MAKKIVKKISKRRHVKSADFAKQSAVDQTIDKQIVKKQKEIVNTFKEKFDKNRQWYEKLSDWVTDHFGTLTFLFIHLVVFGTWIAANLGLVPFVPVFDPYPFGFLTLVVSLEAIVMAIIVQISINRQGSIADMRQEIDFNINVRAEREITKILNIVDKIHDHLGMENEHDHDLQYMKEETDLEEVEREVEKQFKK